MSTEGLRAKAGARRGPPAGTPQCPAHWTGLFPLPATSPCWLHCTENNHCFLSSSCLATFKGGIPFSIQILAYQLCDIRKSLKIVFFFLSPSFHACKIGGDNTHWGFLRVPLENWVPRYSMNITFHIANDTQLCYFASIWQTCHLRKQFRKPMRFSFLISKMKMTIIKLISWACWRMKRVNVWNMLGTGPSTQYMY